MISTQAEAPGLVFVHMAGSHYAFRHHYPPETAKFAFDFVDEQTAKVSEDVRRNINEYDNTIRYTDGVLHAIVEELRQIDRPAFLIYLSDHGETPSSKFMRDAKDKDLWDLPLVMWFSKQYCKEYPEIVSAMRSVTEDHTQTDALMPLLLKTCLVDTAGL